MEMNYGESAFAKTSDGTVVHYHQWGEGPYLVWLHGGGPGATGLSNYAKNISAFANYTNIIIDMPRYGLSSKPVINGSLPTILAKYLLEALESMGVIKASFIGNSLGGAVSISIHDLKPELVEKLILMAPGGMQNPELPLSDPLKLMLQAIAGHPTKENIYQFLEHLVFDKKMLTEETKEARYLAAMDPELIESALQSKFHAESLRPAMAKIKAPTLVLWGREDEVLPLKDAFDSFNFIENCEVRIVSQCGHWVQVEHPEFFNNAVKEFLA